MIQFDSVSKFYDGKKALSGINLRIPEGAFVFLAGHSGAGKSTLLKLIALLTYPTEGRVLVQGQNLTQLRGDRVARLRCQMGMVFQNHHLLLERNVFDNVALPMFIAGHRLADIGRRVSSVLKDVGLEGRERESPKALSAGERQRVSMARALIGRPKILLADEPTGNLDAELSEDIIGRFENLREHGATVIVATHDRELLRSRRHPVLELREGAIIRDEIGAEASVEDSSRAAFGNVS